MVIFSRPQPGTLPITLKLLVTIMVPSIIVSMLGGASASMGFGLAMGLGMAVTPVSKPRQAALLVIVGAALGGLASLAGSTPWAIAILMFISAILFAVTNQRSAGLLSLTPVMVILFGPGPIDLSWWSAVLWILAGGLAGALIVRLLKFQAPTLPVGKTCCVGARYRSRPVVCCNHVLDVSQQHSPWLLGRGHRLDGLAAVGQSASRNP